MNIEYRNFKFEVRAEDDSRHIEGYGSVFGSRSEDLGGFYEIIDPGAFNGVIEKSDVKALLEHDSKRGILARCKNGKGSMDLTVDERGLKYSFDAPHTALGDEVVEGIKRGDYSESSFCFTVDKEAWSRDADGNYIRTVLQIGNLYDVSIVANPAYKDTEVALRSLDEFKKAEEENKEEHKIETVETVVETVNVETVKVETVETVETVEVKPEPEPEPEPEPVLDPDPDDKNDDDNKEGVNPDFNNKNIQENIRKMNFSLLKTIADVVNNRGINEESLEVIAKGSEEMRKSGLSFSGQIQLPTEYRAAGIVAGEATFGKEAIQTDKLDVLAPLRGKSILNEVGATVLTGLVGNVSIPMYSGSTCGWKGELEAADDGKGSFSSVELSPKRLAAYIDISKQFLAQESVGAEEMLMNDINNALIAKLEQTIFGTEAGDINKPAGLFYSAAVEAPSYAAVCNAEATLEDYAGEKVYVMSPSARASFKQTTVSGTKSDLRMLCENNEVGGYRVVTSSNVADKCYALGDFSELVVASWGAIDIVVDPYTLATKNAIRLVINGYFDAKLRRSGAVVAKKVSE